MTFTHLHCHSHYSLLDGLDSPETLVKAAKAAGQPAIAITDHGVLSGHRELYRSAKEHGIKPIFGLEAYISPTDRFDVRSKKKRNDGTSIYNHIILLAKNQIGYENINKMSEIAWTEGYYYKPRIDTELLKEHSEGVIVLTACISGIPAKLIEQDRYDKALEWVTDLKETFGDDLYLEIQGHNPDKINNGLIRLGAEAGVKIVATSDCHRAYEEDKDLQDAFLILSTNPSRNRNEDYGTTVGMKMMERLNKLFPERRMTFQEWNLFIQTREQIAADFGPMLEAEHLDNTLEITDKIEEYEVHEGLDLLPSDFKDPLGELEFKCLSALKDRGLDTKEYYDRIEEELEIIGAKRFSPYFLIVEDIVNWARNEGILVGPGRGSAAGSLVCYVLGITDVDPIKDDLLFFRFINADRNDYPDIDLDFQRSRRGEVKKYVEQKYGHVASIATYVYFRDKGAIKDAAKVLGVPFGQVAKAMKEVEDYNDFVSTTNETVVRFRNAFPDVAPLAKRLQGRIRGSGIHAGGIVVSKEPINKYAPMESAKNPDGGKDRVPIVSLNMKEIESIGLIKFDLLGLKTLDVIQDTMDMAGLTLDDMRSIDRDDPVLINTLANADTVGIFQCDTNPYTRLLKEMTVRTFEDVAASNALIRPGAMNTVGKDFIARAEGTQKITYVHDLVREVLEKTHGTIIYQEQVMQTAVQLGGMSWSDADRLRKIIGKKGDPAEFAQYKQKFMDGATKHISKDKAGKLWQDFEAHAGYSFNRSHAVAYSLLSMWTVWLKKYHTQHYMTALLKNEGEKFKRTHYLIECPKLGIEVHMPDINKSGATFESRDDGIWFGLSDMKYVSERVFAKVKSLRNIESVESLVESSQKKYSGINSRAIEAFRLTGALRNIGGPEVDPDALYEYLDLPMFNVPDLPHARLTAVDEFDEADTMVIGAMVQKIKKDTKGQNWSLIDVVDESGDVGFFDKHDTAVTKGRFYYMLVHRNRLVTSISAEKLKEEMESDSPSALTRALTCDTMTLLNGKSRYVVSAKSRTTRAGKRMADVFAIDESGDIHNYTVFSGDYSLVMPLLRPGATLDFKVNVTKRGDHAIKEVR